MSGKSDKYINQKTNEWKQVVTIDADKIVNAQQVIKDQQPAIHKYQDELNKSNGYIQIHDAYVSRTKDLEKQQEALKKAKKKSEKKKHSN
ncbi:hypothetical protein NBRC111893_2434 [Lentilactobacillus kosonis]|uniref:Uncharacterized protein n=1 Tax=Lentilactobacillus kosonis TaxID=2810561 RepID=A0A401FPT3_9LACO|nr:hypothetical protein NBRC111893_2434 [Lentilactobacillus kosonis]